MDYFSNRKSNEFIDSLDIRNGEVRYKGSKVLIQRGYNFHELTSGTNCIIVHNYSYEQTKLCFDIVIDPNYTMYNIVVGGQKFNVMIHVKYKEPILFIEHGTSECTSVLCSRNGLFVYDFLVRTKSLLTTLSETKSSINELLDEYLSEMGFDTQKSNKILDKYTSGFISKKYNYFTCTMRVHPCIPYNRSDDDIITCIDISRDDKLIKYSIGGYHINIIISNKFYYIYCARGSYHNVMFYECDLPLYEFLIKAKSTFESILYSGSRDDEVFDSFVRLMSSSCVKSAAK